MTLIEAIKSGRPFRRKCTERIGWNGWFYPARIEEANFTAADVVSTDWQIEEPTVTITRANLKEAFKAALMEVDLACPVRGFSIYGHDIFCDIAKRLGLE